jgi:hypothetical protein
MKKLIKMILVAIPALVVAAAVGTTTIGCGDDTTTPTTGDIAVPTVHDMAMQKAPADLTPKGD